jgi:hypothetical protein
MADIVLMSVGDTLGGYLLVRSTAFGDIGIASVKDRKVQQAVYWKAVDTNKVVKAINTLKETI